MAATRLRRVQFGVPPNCHGKRSHIMALINNSKFCPCPVSGATPETTRETRVPPQNPTVHSQLFSRSRKS
jgi:hypothetical protein